jgi:hypothetical protein
VVGGDIKINYMETQQQLADILTKALATKRFEYLRDRLRIAPRQDHDGRQ